jgi:carbohydrate diacid regulator
MREASSREVGVVDSLGVTVASTDLSSIGTQCFPIPEEIFGIFTANGHTLRVLESTEAGFDYAVFAEGEDELARTLCIMAYVAVLEAKQHFEDNNDRSAFVKSILSDNVLPGDIYARAKELHFSMETPRVCLLLRQVKKQDLTALSVLREMFDDKKDEFVVAINPTDIVIVLNLKSAEDENLQQIAEDVERRLEEEQNLKFIIGVGTPARNLRELADRYKEARVAIEVGKVFETERTIICYENLGIGRLVYQLPIKMCEMFLSEVFQKNPISALDAETLYTIKKFFENSLNVSETSRRLFVHRNTLVYRLEKIKKLTGLDLREFDHAIVFQVALMVKKYLDSQGRGGD